MAVVIGLQHRPNVLDMLPAGLPAKTVQLQDGVYVQASAICLSFTGCMMCQDCTVPVCSHPPSLVAATSVARHMRSVCLSCLGRFVYSMDCIHMRAT